MLIEKKMVKGDVFTYKKLFSNQNFANIFAKYLFLDDNECEISNGGCEQQCRNKNGSYVCECNKGFHLDQNGKTCSGNVTM